LETETTFLTQRDIDKNRKLTENQMAK